MSRAFKMTPTAPFPVAKSANFGAGTGGANNWSDKELSKFVKLAGDSRMDLCSVGNEIEGYVNSVDSATAAGYSFGSYTDSGRMYVTFDGLQATLGTGTIAVGDYVVAGTVTAKGTILPGAPKVCKATGAVTTLTFKWRVVSLGTAGTGAVGTVGVIERVSA